METSFINSIDAYHYVFCILFHFLKSPNFDPLKLISQPTVVMTCSPERLQDIAPRR